MWIRSGVYQRGPNDFVWVPGILVSDFSNGACLVIYRRLGYSLTEWWARAFGEFTGNAPVEEWTEGRAHRRYIRVGGWLTYLWLRCRYKAAKLYYRFC